MNESFKTLLQRVRAGDPDAATQLFRDYEPTVRIEIRRRLHGSYLNSSFDSEDVCQSVFKSFFLRAVAGEYELKAPEDLLKLLMRMARNKVVTRVRYEQAQSRDPRRIEGGTDSLEQLPNGPQPDKLAVGRELLERFHQLLTEDEKILAELRASGRTWPEIASELGGNAQLHRRRLERALDRVLRQLGLDDD